MPSDNLFLFRPSSWFSILRLLPSSRPWPDRGARAVSSKRRERGSTGDLDADELDTCALELELDGPVGAEMTGAGEGSELDRRTMDDAAENSQSRKEESKSAPTTICQLSLPPPEGHNELTIVHLGMHLLFETLVMVPHIAGLIDAYL